MMQRTPRAQGLYKRRSRADTPGMGPTRFACLFASLLLCAAPLAADSGTGRRLPLPRLGTILATQNTENETAATHSAAGATGTADGVLDTQRGIASWYGGKFQGRMTANGEIFDTNDYTAAHRTLPFDTVVRVVNPEDNSAVTVRINDRGPFIEGRIIDLSRAAAEAIGIAGHGVAPVVLEILEYPEPKNYRIIQVASFAGRGNAEALVTQLTDAGFTPQIEPAESGVHRVVLPEVPNDELESYRRKLRGLGFAGVLVREP